MPPPSATRVVRLCSVFEPPAASLSGRARLFDPIGGMQNHTACLSRELDRRGIAQEIVTTRPPGAPALQRIGARAWAHRLGLPVPWLRQGYAVFAAPRVHALARRADLVHAHLGEDLAVVPIALAAARGANVPLVLTVHMSLQHTYLPRGARKRLVAALGGRLERVGVLAADAVIVLTPRLADLLVTAGVDAARLHVIPSGVEPSRFAGLRGDALAGVGRPRVGYVGRLCAQKGVRVLVDAFARLPSPAAQLVIVGDGPDRGVVERLAARRGVAGRVHVLGFRHHDEIPALLSALDILAVPSLYEELGSVLLEGLQASLPIVASDTGGIPFALDGAGVLVAPGNASRLARELTALLDDGPRRQLLGALALQRAADFDWSVLASRVHDLYDAVLGRGPLGTRTMPPDAAWLPTQAG